MDEVTKMKTNRIISVVFVLAIIAIPTVTIASSVGHEKFVGIALIDKTTGKLIEYVNTDFDDNGNPLAIPPGTLRSNVIKSGFAASNIEERFVTKTEADILLQVQFEDSMRRYQETYQQEVNAGNIGALKAPL